MIKMENKSEFITGKGLLPKAVAASIPMLLLTALITFGNAGAVKDIIKLAVSAGVYIFMNGLFFLMVYTGKTHKFRVIFFTAIAFCFAVSFISNMIAIRGTMSFNASTIAACETPFCHMVIPMILIPAALTRTVIFPGSMLQGFAAIATMLVIWMAASLTIGRGWCSWVCFYGGYDEGFSHLCQKARMKKIDRKWVHLSFAVLATIVLTSAMTLSPTYCRFLCPFKTVTEFQAVTSLEALLETVVFVSLFAVFVVILPIITRKRTQCGLFCPMGAFQSFTNKLNIFDIRIEKEKCIGCKRCIKECPTFSIDEKSLEKGKACLTCTKCGKCVDVCPKKAICFHVKGTPIVNKMGSRLMFLYPAFLFGFIIGSSIIIDAITKIIKFITTGSML